MFSTVDNRVQLIGFVGGIEVSEGENGKPVARMSLATHEHAKDQDGKKEVLTIWHNLVFQGAKAKNLKASIGRGQRLLVEGKLSYRQYYSGSERISVTCTEIIVSDFKKLQSIDN